METNVSKLEKKAEEKRKNIWKTPVPYVPFAFPFYEGIKIDTSIKKLGAFQGFVLSAIFAIGCLKYGLDSIRNSTLNYKKWPEIKEQRNLEQKTKFYDESNEFFNKYDANKDGVLNSEEFLNYYKEKK